MQKVLFIDGLPCGMRTLIDALLRKQVLNTSVLLEIDSSYVKEVVSGDSERCFTINKDGKKELLNLDDFRKTRMDDFDADPPLRDTEYIVYECPAQANNLTFTVANSCCMLEYGQEILSFPCRKNDAVVYVVNARMPFSQNDRTYIERYLSDGANRNLFFCINGMDTIEKKYVSEIKNITKERLKDVFTTNGVFDEALYQSRVFFIDAYHSLNARLGRAPHIHFGDVDVKDIDTGVPEFEYTLRKFLQHQSIAKQRVIEH